MSNLSVDVHVVFVFSHFVKCLKKKLKPHYTCMSASRFPCKMELLVSVYERPVESPDPNPVKNLLAIMKDNVVKKQKQAAVKR